MSISRRSNVDQLAQIKSASLDELSAKVNTLIAVLQREIDYIESRTLSPGDSTTLTINGVVKTFKNGLLQR